MNTTFGPNELGFQSNNNSGETSVVINNTLYHRAGPPEAQPQPFSTVPFERDADFIERDTLDEIRDKLAPQTARAALIGLGGVGKSQLAVEYAYRVRDQSPNTWVIWLHASTTQRLEQDVKSTLEALKVPERRAADADCYELLKAWLRDESHGPWLVILDNLDDDRVMLDPTQKGHSGSQTQSPCMTCFPASRIGRVLVTSRYRAAVTKMVREQRIIRVEPMSEVQAMAMIEKRLLLQHKRHELVTLVQTLSYMPLAISQAAAYINRRPHQCSVSEYLGILTRTLNTPHEVFEEEDDVTRDPQARNSILAALLISLVHIHELQKSAAELLSLMSFFDRHEIPKALLKTGVSVSVRPIAATTKLPLSQHSRSRRNPAGMLQRREANAHRNFEVNPIQVEKLLESRIAHRTSSFEEDLTLLVDYSFVTAKKDGETFEMHRIVQSVIQRWLRDQKDHIIYYRSRFIDIMGDAFPRGFEVFDKLPVCAALLPHAHRALAVDLNHAIVFGRQKWYQLFVNVEIYSSFATEPREWESLVNYGKAMARFERALRVFEAEEEVAEHIMYALSDPYRGLDFYKIEERMQLRLIHSMKAQSDEKDYGTFKMKSNLGFTYYQQDRLEEARMLQEEALGQAQMSLPCHRGDLLLNMRNLAMTYHKLGRLQDAEMIQKSLLKACWGRPAPKRRSNSRVERVECSKASLAASCAAQGHWEEAERLLEEAVESAERPFGRDYLIMPCGKIIRPRSMSYVIMRSGHNKSLAFSGLKHLALSPVRRRKLMEDWLDGGDAMVEEGVYALKKLYDSINRC